MSTEQAPRAPRDLGELVPHGFSDSGWIDQQRHERAKLEIAYRNGQLRGMPTCFGELED